MKRKGRKSKNNKKLTITEMYRGRRTNDITLLQDAPVRGSGTKDIVGAAAAGTQDTTSLQEKKK